MLITTICSAGIYRPSFSTVEYDLTAKYCEENETNMGCLGRSSYVWCFLKVYLSCESSKSAKNGNLFMEMGLGAAGAAVILKSVVFFL